MQKKGKISNKYLIIGILFLLLITGFFLTRLIFRSYLVAKGRTEAKESFVRIINRSIKEIKGEHLENGGNLDRKIKNSEEIVLDRIRDLKKKGETEIYIDNTTLLCENGERITPKEFFEGERCPSSRAIESEGGGLKKMTLNGSQTLFRVAHMGASRIKLGKSAYFNLNLIENADTPEQLIGIMISQTLFLTKEAQIWTYMRESLMKSFNSSRDEGEIILEFEEFDENYESPSKEEIQDLSFNENCLELMGEASRNKISKTVSLSIWEKILFARSIEKTCENLEKFQKEEAIDLINENKNEENPFLSIQNKIYLNLMVECEEEWIGKLQKRKRNPMDLESNNEDEKEETDCIENYIDNFNKKLEESNF